MSEDLASEKKKQPLSEYRYYVTISKMCHHTGHDFSHYMTYGQTIDANVSKRIKDLVREGVTATQDIKKCLQYYVQDVLFAGKPQPDENCRAFFPTLKDIRNCIQRTLREDRCSSIDQENAL